MQLKFVSCKQDKARQDGAITIDLFGHCKCNGLAVTKYCDANNGFLKVFSQVPRLKDVPYNVFMRFAINVVGYYLFA